MKRSLTLLSALLLLLPSCMHEVGTDASGYLKVDVLEDFSSETVVTKADGGDPVFSLEVKSLRTGKVTTVADASTLSAEPLTLAVGRYSVTASSGEVQNAAFDAPVYAGSQEVQIKPDQTATANITCSLANTMVSVEFPAETANMFTEYSVSVDNGVGFALVFSGANLERTGYFAVTGKLNWSVRMKNTDGLVYQAGPVTIENVKAKQHYCLQYQFGEDNLSNGAGVFSVILDESTNVLTYPLVLDFSDSFITILQCFVTISLCQKNFRYFIIRCNHIHWAAARPLITKIDCFFIVLQRIIIVSQSLINTCCIAIYSYYSRFFRSFTSFINAACYFVIMKRLIIIATDSEHVPNIVINRGIR